MKFIVNSAYLLKQLSNINGVITTNPVVPILENFLFELEKGTLTVTGSDLQTSMITELQVESKEKGKIAVVTAAVGGQGPRTCGNPYRFGEIGAPVLPEL